MSVAPREERTWGLRRSPGRITREREPVATPPESRAPPPPYSPDHEESPNINVQSSTRSNNEPRQPLLNEDGEPLPGPEIVDYDAMDESEEEDEVDVADGLRRQHNHENRMRGRAATRRRMEEMRENLRRGPAAGRGWDEPSPPRTMQTVEQMWAMPLAQAEQAARERAIGAPLNVVPTQRQPRRTNITFNPASNEEEWPKAIEYPDDTDHNVAGEWYNYVPMRRAKMSNLVEEAKTNEQARTRVRDLLSQVNRRPALMGIRAIKYLQEHWRAPPPSYESSTRTREQVQGSSSLRTMESSTRPSSRMTGAHVRDRPAGGMRQPTHWDPPEVWCDYYRRYPQAVPLWLRRPPAGQPSMEDVEGHVYSRRIVPPTKKMEVAARSAMIDNIVKLFSVPGLFRSLVERGGYTYGDHEDLREFPMGVSNISEFDIARWVATCGATDYTIERMERVARASRNFSIGRPIDARGPWLNHPQGINDYGYVPSEAELDAAHGLAPSIPVPPVVDEPMGEVEEGETREAEGAAVTVTTLMSSQPAEGESSRGTEDIRMDDANTTTIGDEEAVTDGGINTTIGAESELH